MIMGHLGSISAGSLSGARNVLDRLDKWPRGNALDVACGTSSSSHFVVSGGVLAWFVQEERAASRSKKGGLSVPNACAQN